jgi:hypothetical protein
MSCDSVKLRSREICLRSGLETSPTGFSWPNLYSWRVSRHLEVYFFRDELPRVSAIQEGTTPLEDSADGGVSLGRWV